MSRSCAYRREISEACNWHQEQALNTNMFILSQTGPTGFLVKEENDSKNYKVFLGDVHNCTCSVFKKEKDLCMHISFILLKKFRVLRTDERSWQLGLNEREINQIIRGEAANDAQAKKSAQKPKVQTDPNNTSNIQQREITEVDCCPICQDELLSKKLPVTFCRFGCGNNVHIQCMKVYADHQKSNGETQLKCPLCRETFCTFENLDLEYRNNGLFKAVKPDLHYGIICKSCNSTPISGKCYKCTQCSEFYLCQACFNTDYHKEHNFLYREKATSKYLKANREMVGLIPQTLAQHLATRELSDEDYELLLQLDERNNAANAKNFSTLTEKIVKSWPSEKVRENGLLLQPGYQCRICLRSYSINQIVRKLPGCKHKFHADCIDNWLIHSHPTCPIDGQVVWDEAIAQMERDKEKELKAQQKVQSHKIISTIPSNKPDLGQLGLIINSKTCIIENKPPSSATSVLSVITPKTNLKKKEKKPTLNNHKKNEPSIKIEGRNMSANMLDDLNEYTNALALAHDLISQHPKLDETKMPLGKTKIKPIKSSQQQKEPNSIPNKLSQIPQIEVKGNKINEFVGLNSANNNLNYITTNLRDDLLFNKTLDVYNIPGFSKPYQLSKPKTGNSKTSDFNTNTYSESGDEDEDYYNSYLDYLIVNESISQQNPENIFSINNNLAQVNKQTDNMISLNETNSLLNQPKLVSKQKLRTHHPPLLNKNKKEQSLDKHQNNEQNLPLVTGMPLEVKAADNSSDKLN